MAQGRSLVLHHRGIMCLSFYLCLGFKILSSSSPNLGSRCSVHILRLVGGLFYPQNFEDKNYEFPSSEQWDD